MHFIESISSIWTSEDKRIVRVSKRAINIGLRTKINAMKDIIRRTTDKIGIDGL